MSFLSNIFGGGDSRSSSEQTSQSTGYSINRGNSSSMSGGSSSGSSAGISGSKGSVFAEDLFRQLYGGALGAAGAIDPKLATDRVNQLFTGGFDIMATLGDGGAGEDYLTKRLSGDNSEILNSQIDALGSDLGRFYSEQLNPAITGSAVASGTLGGGRQGVAQGMATSEVLRQFTTQAANLRANDITSRDNAALGLMGAQSQRGATALAGMESLTSLAGGSQALDPYRALGEIFGGPTVTTEAFGQEMSEQQSQEFAQSLAEELGISYDEASSLLKSTAKGNTRTGIVPAMGQLMGGMKG